MIAIKIKLGEKDIELSIEEAKALKKELCKIFELPPYNFGTWTFRDNAIPLRENGLPIEVRG